MKKIKVLGISIVLSFAGGMIPQVLSAQDTPQVKTCTLVAGADCFCQAILSNGVIVGYQCASSGNAQLPCVCID